MSADEHYEEKYTKPELRRRLKEEIKASDKGGKAGQWSARKSQLLVQEYEKHGGGYKENSKDEAARSLEDWTNQNWQTREGESKARQDDLVKRYLPEEVWELLSEKEKRRAEKSKKQGSKEGEQYVSWTPAIKQAMQKAGYAPGERCTKEELYERAKTLGVQGRSKMSKHELKDAIRDREEMTKEELYQRAQEFDIEGRSSMDKEELAEAVFRSRNG